MGPALPAPHGSELDCRHRAHDHHTSTPRSPFTEADLNEAQQRLSWLARLYVQRLAAAGPEEWDRPRGSSWTLREIAEHVGRPWYAEQAGDLRDPLQSSCP